MNITENSIEEELRSALLDMVTEFSSKEAEIKALRLIIRTLKEENRTLKYSLKDLTDENEALRRLASN